MITTTLNHIRDNHPCTEGWTNRLTGLGKTKGDDEPLAYATILRINGFDDALWCMQAEPQHSNLWRMFAVRCARKVEHLMTDQRSRDALDVAERHANGQATDDDLAAARDAARDAADAAAWAAAWAATRDAALAATWDATWDAERDAQKEIFLDIVGRE